jgi:alanyl-tRNA synthetase
MIIMLSKESLKKHFANEWEKHYNVEIFKEKGFLRKECICGKNFWTLDQDRKTCGDSSCEPYGFIGKPITKKKWDYVKTWKEFEKFFKKEKHESIPRYPVIDRWRPDLFFTIASIQDFQRIDKGNMVMSYPSDPLIVPQVCLRFPDIPNVGVTGRHHTSFIMPGQHSFGAYWKDRCIELNFRFLNSVMGIPEKEIVYVEDLWSMPDFSQFGPSLETTCKGLELVNSVFSQFTKSGSSYKELPQKVIDVGWGHERLVWFTQGTLTGYDAVFGDVINWVKKQTGFKESDVFNRYSTLAGTLDFEDGDIKKRKELIANRLGIGLKELRETIEPVQAVYAITDHMKTLLFAVADGGIPSNVGGGYNLRVILRRALAFLKEFGLDLDLMKIAELHGKFLKPMFPELRDGMPTLHKIMEIERERYEKTMKKAEFIINNELGKGIDEKKLITLYTSHGINPELIEKAAKEKGIEFKTPEDFYVKVTSHHMKGEKSEEDVIVDTKGVRPTKPLFYEDPYKKEFTADVLKTIDGWVVLDKTYFYAEGGGQPSDRGVIILGEKEIMVKDTQKIGDVILHKVDEELPSGKEIKGRIDWKRRYQLMKMHDATHILAGSVRKILGAHIWQAGAHKGLKTSRIDLTHFKPFTTEELEKIEELSNKIVRKGLKINSYFMPREEAEKKYGFVIYQGGASPGKELRIIEIPGHDVEACGGTHAKNTNEVGMIKIVKTERIQDGVNRIEFTCGDMAEEFIKSMEGIYDESMDMLENFLKTRIEKRFDIRDLGDASAVFSVDANLLPKTLEKFIKKIEENVETINNIRVRMEKEAASVDDYLKTSGQSLKSLSEDIFSIWKHTNREVERLTEESSKSKSHELVKKAKDGKVFDIISGSRKELIEIASDIIKVNPSLTVILANQAGDIIGMSNKEDMSKVIPDLCKRAGGSGGGNQHLAQGRIELSKLIKIMGRS